MLQASLAYRTIDTGEKDIWSQGGQPEVAAAVITFKLNTAYVATTLKLHKCPNVQLLLEGKV